MYSNRLVCNIIDYIDENINTKISIEEIEKIFFYNRYYIMKLFKKEMKVTIVDYINSFRIYNALCQLRETNNKILNIAYKNGFYSLEYFSEMFKKVVGVNPKIAKDYFNNKKNISLKSIDLINNSIVNLSDLKDRKEKYLLNQKPSHTMVKKLTIFK